MHYQKKTLDFPIAKWVNQAYNYRPINFSRKSVTLMATVSAISSSNIYRGNLQTVGVPQELSLADSSPMKALADTGCVSVGTMQTNKIVIGRPSSTA